MFNDQKINKPRTIKLEPTTNKTFSVGVPLAVDAYYRKRDSIEKIFHSLKNEIEIKSVRCWKKECQIGALLIGFLAQLFVSLMRYDVWEVAHTSTKFIKTSLRNLTDTIMRHENGRIAHSYFNFDAINMAILRCCGAMT